MGRDIQFQFEEEKFWIDFWQVGPALKGTAAIFPCARTNTSLLSHEQLSSTLIVTFLLFHLICIPRAGFSY